MSSAAEYRAKAKEALGMASDTNDIVAIRLWNMLADDYLGLAEAEERAGGQQQQQIRPKADDGEPPHSD
jgi:hypothetical protein